MDDAPSFFQAVASLLLVLALIWLTAFILKRFSFRSGINGATFGKGKGDKQMKLVETLWLDARYRIVLVENGASRHTILLGPQQALQLSENPADLNAHASQL